MLENIKNKTIGFWNDIPTVDQLLDNGPLMFIFIGLIIIWFSQVLWKSVTNSGQQAKAESVRIKTENALKKRNENS